MSQSETFEYGFLYVLLVEGYSTDAEGRERLETVAFVETSPGLSFEADGKTVITLLNEFGQQGWMISQLRSEAVENNDVPSRWIQMMISKRGQLGRIRRLQSYSMTRRIMWPDDRSASSEPL